MPKSFNLWTRLEGRPRSEDIRDSLQARIHDPLWLLARQWQVGEFQGEDGGSPVQASVRGTQQRISHYRPDGGASIFYNNLTPLEALVEAEPPPQDPGVRFAAEAGLHFLRLLRKEGVSEASQRAYVDHYPLQYDTHDPRLIQADERFLRVMSRRAPDGRQVFKAIQEINGDEPSPEEVVADALEHLRDVLNRGLRRVRISPVEAVEHEAISVQVVFIVGLMPGDIEIPSRDELREMSDSGTPLGQILQAGLESLELSAEDAFGQEEVGRNLVQFVRAWMEHEEISLEEVLAEADLPTARVFAIGQDVRETDLPEWIQVQELELPLRTFLHRGIERIEVSQEAIIEAGVESPLFGRVLLAALAERDIHPPDLEPVLLTRIVRAGFDTLQLEPKEVFETSTLNDELREWLRNIFPAPGVPGADHISPDDYDAVRNAVDQWRQWYRDEEAGTGASSAWQPERMEYAFSLSIPSEEDNGQRLHAPAYHGGRLDWYHFRVAAPDGMPVHGASSRFEETLIPTEVAFPGSPAARWWEFEDRRVNFDAVTSAPTDLMQALLLDYRLIFSNDWFMLPFDVPLGSVIQVDKSGGVEITSTFAPMEPATTLQPAASEDWRLFHLSADDEDTTGMLFVPPVLASSLRTETLERVRFGRDEVANLAWAIEQVVLSLTGQPVNRRELLGATEPTAHLDTEAMLHYLIRTPVPEYWFPLVPSEDGRLLLHLLRALDSQSEPQRDVTEPLGRVLGDRFAVLNQAGIHAEEVPRSGIIVRRRRQMARWSDGSTHVWEARHKRYGGRALSSGLRFDVVQAPEKET